MRKRHPEKLCKFSFARSSAAERKDLLESVMTLESEPHSLLYVELIRHEEARCLVPAIDGAYFSECEKEASWDRYYT